MCADGNTRAALPRLFLRVGIMAHEWICSRSGGRIHAAPCACGTPREELWRGCDRISCRWDAQKWFSDSTDFALPCPVLSSLTRTISWLLNVGLECPRLLHAHMYDLQCSALAVPPSVPPVSGRRHYNTLGAHSSRPDTGSAHQWLRQDSHSGASALARIGSTAVSMTRHSRGAAIFSGMAQLI